MLPGSKTCSTCGTTCPIEAPKCNCGACFPPPVVGPPRSSNFSGPGRQGFIGAGTIPTETVLSDLAAQYRKANKTFLNTLILGIFCIHPLWIWSFFEWNKMKDINQAVAGMGVDLFWWQATYNAK